jgi:hypothetical protein
MQYRQIEIYNKNQINECVGTMDTKQPLQCVTGDSREDNRTLDETKKKNRNMTGIWKKGKKNT